MIRVARRVIGRLTGNESNQVIRHPHISKSDLQSDGVHLTQKSMATLPFGIRVFYFRVKCILLQSYIILEFDSGWIVTFSVDW